MKLKCPNLLKPQKTMCCPNSQFYYPSDPFIFRHFNVRHPVDGFQPASRYNKRNVKVEISSLKLHNWETPNLGKMHKLVTGTLKVQV